MEIPGFIKVTDTIGRVHMLRTSLIKDIMEVCPPCEAFPKGQTIMILDIKELCEKRSDLYQLTVDESFECICEKLYDSSHYF